MFKPLKSSTSNWAIDDIAAGNWNRLYKFEENAPLSFKVIDNGIFVRNIQTELKKNSEFTGQYEKHLDFLGSLSEIKIWLKTEGHVVPMSLVDIYHSFVRNLRDDSFDDQLYNCSLISFMGPLGPFKEIPLVECLNDRMIEKFLFNSSVKSKIPTRKLRVRTSGHIMVSHGENFERKNNIQIKQITDTGVLFSSKDGFIIDDFSKSNTLKFHINTTNLQNFTQNNLKFTGEKTEEFFYSDDDLRYFFVDEGKVKRSLSYKSEQTNEFFLFIRYQDMMESDVPSVFRAFTEKANDYFLNFTQAA